MALFVSPSTRSLTTDSKATKRPLAEIEAPVDPDAPKAWLEVVIRSVTSIRRSCTKMSSRLLESPSARFLARE